MAEKLLELAEAEYIRQNEKARQQPPTQVEVKRVVRFLRDFGISVAKNEIPQFDNIQELELWKKKLIAERLDRNAWHTRHQRQK